MGVELRPYGVKCNIQCQYCYQNPERDANNTLHSYDMERMKAAVEREGGPFTLFGGEPLLLRKADLENLWAWGLEKYGSNSVQTNGVLIDDDHIRMFKQYRVHVGISVDGPGALNDVRWAGSLQRTREATEKTHAVIARLSAEGIPPSVIITLHRNNATRDKLPRMFEWVLELESLGVTSARLHLLEVEDEMIRKKYALTTQENIEALRGFARLEHQLTNLSLDLFTDMRNLLRAQDDSVTCIWAACDAYTTAAVRGIEGNGQSSNCGRTNKDGIDFTKADQAGFERYIALFHTPQEHGGCSGCRFFLMCKGQCPGTAIDGDWRNRTEHCEVWKALFRDIEEEIIDAGDLPLSADPFRKEVERAYVSMLFEGRTASLRHIIDILRANPSTTGAEMAMTRDKGHGDRPHGDAPHGDSWHSDQSRRASYAQSPFGDGIPNRRPT